MNKSIFYLVIAMCDIILALCHAFIGNMDMANFLIGWTVILLCMTILEKIGV